MSTRFSMSVYCVVLLWAVPIFGQEPIGGDVRRVTQDETSIKQRTKELLQRPTFITLRLLSMPRDVPPENSTDTPAPYIVKDWIRFRLLVGQTLVNELSIATYRNPYYEVRPILKSDGEIIPYSKQAELAIARAEATFPAASELKLKPGREYELQQISLKDWYEPLLPGRYEITVRRRFEWQGDWATSTPLYFEVIPQPPSAPIPAGVSIEIVPDRLRAKKDGAYQATSDIAVVFFVVNNSDQPVKRNVIDREYGNQPQLFRDGVLIPYRQDIVERIRAKEENPRLIEITNDVYLEPKMRSWGHGISLKDWYGPLPHGSYRLINRQRFEIDGPWTADSAPLLFEVVAAGQ